MPPAKKKTPPPEVKPDDLPAPVVDEAEQAAQQRYEEALAAGFSDDEAREIGWPAAGALPGDAAPPTAEEPVFHNGGASTEPPKDDGFTGEPPAPKAPQLVAVAVPCRVCYPDGWPAPVEGASASCHHGVNVTYGTPTILTAEVAAAAGFEV